jgi:hypothetical protein
MYQAGQGSKDLKVIPRSFYMIFHKMASDKRNLIEKIYLHYRRLNASVHGCISLKIPLSPEGPRADPNIKGNIYVSIVHQLFQPDPTFSSMNIDYFSLNHILCFCGFLPETKHKICLSRIPVEVSQQKKIHWGRKLNKEQKT